MSCHKNRGFSLVELLAVIVVLAVIALIVTPIITNSIEDSKKAALKSSAEALIKGAMDYVTSSDDMETKTFNIENGAFVSDKLSVSGKLPDSGIVVATDNLQTAIAVIDGKWCAKKDYDDSEVIVNDDLDNCVIEPVLVITSEKCFAFNTSTKAITDYYDYEENISTNPACPRDVLIPAEIGNTVVEIIGNSAFREN